MPVPPRPMTVSNTLSRRIDTQGHQTMKAQIAACLLCLLIVGAFLDGLPDPPAVKPQCSRNNLVCPLHHKLYLLQRRAMYQIVLPATLIFRPASFCLDRFPK